MIDKEAIKNTTQKTKDKSLMKEDIFMMKGANFAEDKIPNEITVLLSQDFSKAKPKNFA